MFTIKSLTIYEDCKYRKILEPGTYDLGECEIEDFYGPNIRLHALVGKNGSGKSSLLDMALRLMNNFAVILCRYEIRVSAELLHYVLGLHADLDYEIKDNCGIHYGKLCVHDRAIWLHFDGVVYWFSDNNLLNQCREEEVTYCAMKDNEDYKKLLSLYEVKDYTGHLSKETVRMGDVEMTKTQHLAQMFFYTLATNYSMLGFLANDYSDERALCFHQQFIVDSPEKKNIIVDNGSDMQPVSSEKTIDDGKQDNVAWAERTNWITGLFHKNDGYMCPVNLNPYRDFGTIDMDTETELTISRLCVLLAYEDPAQPVFKDYKYDHIDYSLKKDFYLKFKERPSKSPFNVGANELKDEGDLKLFKLALMYDHSYSKMILDAFGYTCDEKTHKLLVRAYEYLCYKVLSIAKKYPLYAGFMDIGYIDRIFDDADYPEDEESIKKIVDRIKDTHTHIEIKIHQMLYFIETFKSEKHEVLDKLWKDGFSFSDYKKYYKGIVFKTNIERQEHMPPNIFRRSLYMERTKGKNAGQKVPFEKLSSGERQFIYQMTAIIYHLQNLRMVSDEAIHYKNLNLVLDEIEVCYHPEYQRQFIGQLIDLLTRMKFNEDFGIHIWLTTHSPFVLSDIPQSCTTYLVDGHKLNENEIRKLQIKNPFCANINDTLHQSFFLEQGFIGEYARRKVQEMLNRLRGETPISEEQWTCYEKLIDNIGDVFLQKQLYAVYVKKRYGSNKALLRKWFEEKIKEIDL